jgi:hypothetical protein
MSTDPFDSIPDECKAPDRAPAPVLRGPWPDPQTVAPDLAVRPGVSAGVVAWIVTMACCSMVLAFAFALFGAVFLDWKF